ncbi:hypothetical protein ABW20_dc0106149 [Dactylellina cionopaga]|nr:hypothetical protein ABW20_dc0106149 [Dactylellina cionopaga]
MLSNIKVASIALFALSVSALKLQGEYRLAKRVEPSKNVARATFIGGWALGGGFEGTCPANSTQCKDMNGTCCPSNSSCAGQGNFGGVACCPSGSTTCGPTILAIPLCADPTWELYEARSSYFCCESGQQGIYDVSSRIVLIVGLCVPGDQNVPPANVASRATFATKASTSTASSSTDDMTSEAMTSETSASQPGSTTNGAATTAATTSAATTAGATPTAAATTSATPNSGVLNAVSIGPLLAVLGLLSIALFL